MRKISFIALPLVLVLASCATKGNTTTATEASVATTTMESSLSYRALSDSVNAYYMDVDTTKRGTAFIDELTPVISKGYVRYSYKGAWDVLAEADKDPYNPSNVICMYTGKSIPANLDSTSKGWNREHTWAKSHGFNKESMEAYTDCHHLTATDSSINSIRGDLDFGEVSDYEGTVSKDSYGNQWITGTIFEPRDEVKGDIARMLFYMMARYNDTTLNLELKDGITSVSDTGYGELGDLTTLLKWNYEDPVSDTEIERNEVVYSYQKNRNPFIDHPEWVNYMFPDTEYVSMSVNEDKVTSVKEKIDALPSLITLDNEEEVTSILKDMNSLNAQEKLYVSNYPVLSEAKYQIDYLKNNSSASDADITIDFSSLASKDSGGYKGKTDLSISNYSFTVSAYYTGSGEFRLGTNGKSISAVSLSEYNLSSTGSYLKGNFSTEDITGVTIKLSSTYSSIDAFHIYGINDEGVTEFDATKGTDSITAETKAFTGSIAVVIEGSTARLGISSIEIYTE